MRDTTTKFAAIDGVRFMGVLAEAVYEGEGGLWFDIPDQDWPLYGGLLKKIGAACLPYISNDPFGPVEVVVAAHETTLLATVLEKIEREEQWASDKVQERAVRVAARRARVKSGIEVAIARMKGAKAALEAAQARGDANACFAAGEACGTASAAATTLPKSFRDRSLAALASKDPDRIDDAADDIRYFLAPETEADR